MNCVAYKTTAFQDMWLPIHPVPDSMGNSFYQLVWKVQFWVLVHSTIHHIKFSKEMIINPLFTQGNKTTSIKTVHHHRNGEKNIWSAMCRRTGKDKHYEMKLHYGGKLVISSSKKYVLLFNSLCFHT